MSSEKNVLLIAARLGLSQPPKSRPKKKRSFRSIAVAVVFLCRARYALHICLGHVSKLMCSTSSMGSESWRRTRVDRDTVIAGYELARGHALRA